MMTRTSLLLLLGCLASFVCAQVTPSPPCGTGLQTVQCGPQTFACVSGRCFCQPRFFGADCTQHFFTTRPDLFYGIYGTTLPLYYLLAAFAVFLIVFYFFRFVPTLSKHNPQILGIVFCFLAALMRVIHGMIYIIVGPSVEVRFFWLGPTAVELVTRYAYGLYFPFAFGAFTLQVLLWVDFVFAVRKLKATQSSSWLPRFGIVLMVILFLLFCFVIVVETLATLQFNVSVLYFVYRISFATYLALLMLLALFFAVKILRTLGRRSKVVVESTAAERQQRSRRNLTWMVLFTVFVLACALAIALVMAFGRYEGIGFDADLRADSYWILLYFERLFACFVLFPIMLSFQSMMKSRMLQVAGVMSDSQNLATHDDGVDLKEPLIYGGADNQENFRASVRSSRAGSLLDSELDEESEDGAAHTYAVGDRVWSQHRSDGLWYRSRVTQVDGDTTTVEYEEYDVTDTVAHIHVCPDYQNLLSPSAAYHIKAFDCRPSRERLAEVKASGKMEPDAFGLVGLKGRESRRPNHTSLLLKKKVSSQRQSKKTLRK